VAKRPCQACFDASGKLWVFDVSRVPNDQSAEFHVAVLEALKSFNPAISSNHPNLREVIENAANVIEHDFMSDSLGCSGSLDESNENWNVRRA
jgi:hypothetical protein